MCTPLWHHYTRGFWYDSVVEWHWDHKTDPLASSAEYLNETFEKTEFIKNNNDWDFAIAISDLPSISSNKVVISEFNQEKNSSLISVPAFSIYGTKKKLQNLLIHHIEHLYADGSYKASSQIKSNFINKITEVTTSEGESSNKRYILKSTIGGWSKLVSGMTFMNEPWREISNLKTQLHK